MEKCEQREEEAASTERRRAIQRMEERKARVRKRETERRATIAVLGVDGTGRQRGWLRDVALQGIDFGPGRWHWRGIEGRLCVAALPFPETVYPTQPLLSLNLATTFSPLL